MLFKKTDDINSFIQEERKAELQYWLTGDSDSFSREKRNIYILAGKKHFTEEKQEPARGMYRDELKYAGDLELAFQIEREEKQFRSVRKQLNERDYGQRLRRLIHLRNQYARTAGFENYLDYKYALWGIEPAVLNKAAARQLMAEKTDITQLKNWLMNVTKDERLAARNQRKLLKQIDMGWNLNLERIQIHDKHLPEFYIGACVPVCIPDDIHVLINMQPGLSGFSVFMHEMGHAFYYNNITSEDIYGRKEPFNLIMEETVALLFENQVYTENFLTEFLNIHEDMWPLKANGQLNYLLSCAEFEEKVYRAVDFDFDREWEAACALTGERGDAGWTRPHFFISNPGYFAAYFIAGFLAKEVYLYADRTGQNLFEFMRNEICRPGRNLRYDILLNKIWGCF